MELLFVVFQGLISNVNMQKIQDPGTCCKLCFLKMSNYRKEFLFSEDVL